jgi:hypothetical protein
MNMKSVVLCAAVFSLMGVGCTDRNFAGTSSSRDTGANAGSTSTNSSGTVGATIRPSPTPSTNINESNGDSTGGTVSGSTTSGSTTSGTTTSGSTMSDSKNGLSNDSSAYPNAKSTPSDTSTNPERKY